MSQGGSGASLYWKPASLEHLRKVGQKGPLYDYLQRFAWQDRVLFFDDFIDDTLNATRFAVANSGGTSAASFAVRNDIAHGTIQADTGTDNGGSVSLIGDHVAWLGDYNAGIEFRVKTDVVTDFNLEVGFGPSVPGANAPQVADVDVPTVVADSAVFVIDTSQTLTTAAFVTDGSTANQDPKKTNITGVPSFTNGNLPVADTFYIVTIQLVGNSAYCFVNNKLVASHDDDAQGNIEGGTKLAPWVYCRTRSAGGVAVFPEIDYVAVWQDRV